MSSTPNNIEAEPRPSIADPSRLPHTDWPPHPEVFTSKWDFVLLFLFYVVVFLCVYLVYKILYQLHFLCAYIVYKIFTEVPYVVFLCIFIAFFALSRHLDQ